MKKLSLFYLFISILILPAVTTGQGATNKNRGQLPNSFYTESVRHHDGILARDQKNSTTSIIDNLNNPDGTVVLDGDAKLQASKEALEHYNEIVFSSNYVEVPFANKNVTYRVRTVNYSPHHSLKSNDVLMELQQFLRSCVQQTHEVPSVVKLAHVDRLESCAFFSYRSRLQSGLSYYMARLNLACVWMPFLRETDVYARR